MSESDDSDVVKKVLDYLMVENRPFTVNDILNHFQNYCSKTAIKEALHLLMTEGKVKQKTYGKHKVFYVNQNVYEDFKDDDSDDGDNQIIELTNTYSILKSLVSRYGIVIENLLSLSTLERAREEILKVEVEDEILSEKMKKLLSTAPRITRREIKTVSKYKKKYQKTVKQRKRRANDKIDAIGEGKGKNRKEVMAEVGIQTDTD